MAGAFVLATMAVVAVIASRSSADALSGKAEQGLAASTDALVATLDVYEKGLESNVRQIFGAFLGTLPQTTITLVLDERIPVGERDAPALRMDDRLINGDFAIVDDFTTNTEAVVTVFVFEGDDFIRINNSLMNDAGLRVMGTALSRESPAYELLLAGEPYTGSANLFGVDYVTQYEPLFSASGTTDDDGAVIGAIFVGVRYDDALAALEEKFGALDLGDGGRIVVVEGQGDAARFAVHPRLAGTPLAGDEAKPEASAFADSVARGPGAYTLDLPLLAGDGVAFEEHRVVVREFAPWKWTLVALAPESEVAAEARALGWRVAGFSLLGALAIIAAIVWLSRQLVALPLARAAAFAGAVASGDLDARPDGKAQAEIGALNRALSDMIDKLRERQDLERRAAAQVEQLSKESSAVANALDAASSAVMMTDADHAIRYVNRAMAALLAAAEPALAEAVPGFTATQAVGLDFQHFHALDATNGPGAVEKTFGGRVFLIETSPWFDEAGVYSGSVVGWTERTAELAVQDEVRAIVAQAAAGDLSGRIALDGKQGFIRELGEAINAMLDATRGGVVEVQAVLAALAEGDLSVRSNAALRGVFASMRDDANRSAEHLSQVIAAIRDAAQSISTASGEIAAGNRDLSARTEQQAASLEETASSMDELTATVKQNAGAAKQAEALAASAADVAVEGGKVVADVVTTMAQIQASSKKIGDIVGTINGIAFQTNILAINAAIEAARAGESGRGFAVVASEVRSLAQRTADASMQIRGIIDESNRRIGAGTEQAGRAGSTMQQIVGSVRRVTDLIGDISAASVEQAQGIQQVNEAITQIDETTQQNAALVEEASAAAHSMEEQAADLMGLVERFRLADASDA